ncbi:3-demethylubiquinone-9 3-O-methyltransferase [Candidatus Endolissoclinum faulkneri L2]|uniref:Ubiquinone biosynthesis O-methyltransferase n=1 Tax=Candidatus Endolissoclinum faulkneri L2 TaxID=1193729 RepID=K7YFH6_9PROT|nr:bifunctional 2-polyprenyl-6-hydroxyphenol methylase/3-demethylubiquinol 3-O-methyltransferase UbiG [Candidatus Endolissoclinum faulkneri]AFX98335.1 3-demethylubiquinone-9 3-O-methyltransferase [Candidatus Endolissoclinum faulkneri L2]
MLKSLFRLINKAQSNQTQQASNNTITHNTFDIGVINNFAEIAEYWWDPEKHYWLLHCLVPVRMQLIKDFLAPLGKNTSTLQALAGLKVLDVGCGGGLLSEPMARLGAKVIGIDADSAGIAIAIDHALKMGLNIDYRIAAPEDLVDKDDNFDAIIASEVIEHVNEKSLFLNALASLLQPGGILIITTINRTFCSYIKAIVGAEYILRWVSLGTHRWNNFLTPSELTEMLKKINFNVHPAFGFTFKLNENTFALSTNVRINYAVIAQKKV